MRDGLNARRNVVNDLKISNSIAYCGTGSVADHSRGFAAQCLLQLWPRAVAPLGPVCV